MSLPPTKFEDASRVESLGSHEYGIKVHPDFAWGSVAHGGYLFSLLWKAIAEHYRTTLKSYDQPDTVAMHVELLRPVPLGEAVIQVKDVRLGKRSPSFVSSHAETLPTVQTSAALHSIHAECK